MAEPVPGVSGAGRAVAGLPQRVLAAFVLGQTSLHAAMAGLRLALPLFMLHQGGWGGLPAGAAAGITLGLFAAAPVLLALPAGRWVDRRGYHKPVRAAVSMCLVGGVFAVLAMLWAQLAAGPDAFLHPGLAAAGQGLLVLLAGTLVGAGCNVGLIAMQRSAGRLAEQGARAAAAAAPLPGGAPADAAGELRRVFSWVGIAPALGNVVGPLLAGLFIDHFGYAWACALLALLPLGKAWCARVVPAEAPTAAATPAAAAAAPVAAGSTAGAGGSGRSSGSGGSGGSGGVARRPTLELLGHPGIRRLLVVNWFFSASWDLHAFVVPLLGHERGLSASAIGTVLGVFAAAVAGVRVLLPLVARALRERQVLVGALVAVGLVFAVYPLAQDPLQMGVCACVLGLALGVVQPMVMTALHHLAPPDRQGEAIALRSAVINCSSALLPLVFGGVGAALGAALLFRGMALVLLAGLPLVARLPATREA